MPFVDRIQARIANTDVLALCATAQRTHRALLTFLDSFSNFVGPTPVQA